MRQITRSRRVALAAAMVPVSLLILVTAADLATLRYGFGSGPVYLLSQSNAVSPQTLLRHFTLPILVSISALVMPSIIMSDVLLGERERHTMDLLVALPVSVREVITAKMLAVLAFALLITGPLFIVHLGIIASFGQGSGLQAVALSIVLLAAVLYSTTSSLLIALLTGESRAANILSGFFLGPVVPIEGALLLDIPGEAGAFLCAALLAILSLGALFWSSRLLSFSRLLGL